MPARESPITIESVEHLVGILGEAAEIEHGLMCCYLYAAYGLKTKPEDGLPEARRAVVARWRGAILSVAIEEMAHLALVSNLLVSLGARPHFTRQNFPVAPGLHPADVVVALAPFEMATLDHFIFLERPEGVDLPDGAGFQPPLRYQRGGRFGHYTPVAQDYQTVGHLYREIASGLTRLAAEVGEGDLFCGHASAQVGPDVVQLPGLIEIVDLRSALQAIDNIVEQGEGSPGHTEDSHYQRFLAIKAEYQAILAEEPDFQPSRPVARNPVMRRPPNPEGRVYIDAEEAAAVLDIVNALYGQMLRCLTQAYGRADRAADQKRDLVDAAIALMGAMTPVAERLTTLPANSRHPGVNAGMTFATLRGLEPYLEGASEWRNLARRTRELARGLEHVTEIAPEAGPAARALHGIAARFEARLGGDTPVTTAPPPPAAAPQPAIEVAEGRDLTLMFEGKRCIHARHCVLGAPSVFLANTPGTWLFPDTMDGEKLVAIAEMCPSGAIQYRRKTDRPNEAAPAVNVANIRENGPLAIRAEMRIAGSEIGMRATLCRCGQSKNKPYCDGSHVAAGFAASGEPPTGDVTALKERGGVLDIEPQLNGPLKVTGNLEICAGTGRSVARVTATKLCRCGQSRNKPFCDGSHRAAGFEAPGV